MIRKRKGALAVALLAATALSVSACSSGGRDKSADNAGGVGAGDNSGYTIAFITHETPGDTFWDKIKAGAQQAAKNEGITLKYSNDPEAPKQAQLIQSA